MVGGFLHLWLSEVAGHRLHSNKQEIVAHVRTMRLSSPSLTAKIYFPCAPEYQLSGILFEGLGR